MFDGLKAKRPAEETPLPTTPLPPKNGVVVSGAKEVDALLRRTESVAEFQEWDKTDANQKRLAIMQKSLKDRELSKKKRVPLLDPELDKGKVKKVKAKTTANEEEGNGLTGAALLDRAAKQLLSNRKAHRSKQQHKSAKKKHKVKTKKFI